VLQTTNNFIIGREIYSGKKICRALPLSVQFRLPTLLTTEDERPSLVWRFPNRPLYSHFHINCVIVYSHTSGKWPLQTGNITLENKNPQRDLVRTASNHESRRSKHSNWNWK